MSKKDDTKKEDSVKWTFGGNEDEWDGFDRRITRWMRKKYDSMGEKRVKAKAEAKVRTKASSSHLIPMGKARKRSKAKAKAKSTSRARVKAKLRERVYEDPQRQTQVSPLALMDHRAHPLSSVISVILLATSNQIVASGLLYRKTNNISTKKHARHQVSTHLRSS